MKTAIITLSIIVFSLILNSNQLFAQSEKIDFKVEWKADSVKNIVKVTILNGEPQTIKLYDNTPFEDGKLLIQNEVLSDKIFEIEVEKKIKLCVCVVKDASTYNCKWLVVEK